MVRTALLAVAGALALATAACSGSPAPGPAPSLDEATRQYLDDNAVAFAEQLGIDDPPHVDPVRLITLSEWKSTQISCLIAAGFDATETPDGQGVSYPQLDDPALRQSLNLAIYTCEMQYPTQQKYMSPLSADGLEALYTYRTGDLLDCLAAAGYDIPDEPPSLTVFLQSDGEWTPYAELSIRQDDLRSVLTSCPQTPDSVYDY